MVRYLRSIPSFDALLVKNIWELYCQMKLLAQETSLVIAGSWNPAILTPEWVLIHGLNKTLDGTNKITAAIPVGYLFQFPRFELEDLSFIARTDALVFFPTATEEGRLAILETVAKCTLEKLCHTPITGIGHNFEFQDDTPNPDLLGHFSLAQQHIVDVMPDGFSVASNEIKTSIKHATEDVIINISSSFDGGRLGVKFNFHYPVDSTTKALEILNSDAEFKSLYKNYLIAKDLTSQLYGEVTDD